MTWTPETLRGDPRSELRGQDVIVVSNREPYIHIREQRRRLPCSARRAASSPRSSRHARLLGHLDRARQRHRPTARPSTRTTACRCRPTIPRTSSAASGSRDEEEAGYYYGFANEGLWPLCHIAHVRPIFRATDLASTTATVNQRFADAVVAGSAARRPDRAGAGLPLRAAAADDPRAAAARDDHHVLAHPVAESRGVRDLPVARGAARRPARQQHPRLPHAVPLQQLPRHRRPHARGARRPRDRSP